MSLGRDPVRRRVSSAGDRSPSERRARRERGSGQKERGGRMRRRPAQAGEGGKQEGRERGGCLDCETTSLSTPGRKLLSWPPDQSPSGQVRYGRLPPSAEG